LEECKKQSNLKLPLELSQLFAHSDSLPVNLPSRVEAPSGFYATKNTPGPGNSLICFSCTGIEEWCAGQIEHIVELENGEVQFAVWKWLDSNLVDDPFRSFWEKGFEAKTVSSTLSKKLILINFTDVIGHCAIWNPAEQLVIAINLGEVSRIIHKRSYYPQNTAEMKWIMDYCFSGNIYMQKVKS
jgi:hypothetical protein